jgi:ABC-type uncharacterized transport system substrate-binding protein
MAALADSSTLTETKARALQEAARARNIDLYIHLIAKGEEIPAGIDKAHASGATALNVFASPMLHGNGRLIMERVAALRLPAMYQWAEMAEEGGFAAYGPRLNQLSELAARFAANLLTQRGHRNSVAIDRNGSQAANLAAMRNAFHSAVCSPDPPNSAGKSLNFGRPSRMGRTVSA